MDAEEGAGRGTEPEGGPLTFEELGLDPRVLMGVLAAGFTSLRPIQARAIPPALLGRDVLGLARTGTGKTAAFALPLLDRLLREPADASPRALVLAPTRELASQIAKDIAALGQGTGLSVVLIIGGVAPEAQRAQLAAGPAIVVATTGRLLDHVRAGAVELSGVLVLVLDEADRMIDMGFLPDVRAILAAVGEGAQTMMFSATMPPSVQALAQNSLRSPEILDLGGGVPAETIDHALVFVRESAKPKLLRKLMEAEGFGSSIVFVRTKQRAKALAYGLEKRGVRVALLHGDRGQTSRTTALDRFRSGDADVLVATDLASRGLDVEAVGHVVNYDVPLDPDTYVHRIGRTGRAERSGAAVTFVSEGDLTDIRAIEHRIGARIARRTVEGFAPLDDEDMTGERRAPGRRRGSGPGSGSGRRRRR